MVVAVTFDKILVGKIYISADRLFLGEIKGCSLYCFKLARRDKSLVGGQVGIRIDLQRVAVNRTGGIAVQIEISEN